MQLSAFSMKFTASQMKLSILMSEPEFGDTVQGQPEDWLLIGIKHSVPRVITYLNDNPEGELLNPG